MKNYKKLLERFEKDVLNGMVNSAAHQARVIFVEWLEKQSIESPHETGECPTCAGLGFVNDDRGRRGVDCSDCNGSGIRR